MYISTTSQSYACRCCRLQGTSICTLSVYMYICMYVDLISRQTSTVETIGGARRMKNIKTLYVILIEQTKLTRILISSVITIMLKHSVRCADINTLSKSFTAALSVCVWDPTTWSPIIDSRFTASRDPDVTNPIPSTRRKKRKKKKHEMACRKVVH